MLLAWNILAIYILSQAVLLKIANFACDCYPAEKKRVQALCLTFFENRKACPLSLDVANNFGFHIAHKGDTYTLLKELLDKFQEGKGGGTHF